MSRRSKKQRLKKATVATGGNPRTAAAVLDVQPVPSASPGAVNGPSGNQIPRNWKVAGICASLVILVFSVFGQTLRFDFINYDDNLTVYENPVIARGLTLPGIVMVFTQGQSAANPQGDYWHPLTWMVHMLDCQLFGMWSGGHHLTNVILHSASVVLLFLVLFQMTGALWRCAFVAAAWAIHPLRAASVAWVSELKDVLSALFFMLTLLAYVRYVRKPCMTRYMLVVISFVLGLMSKNMVVTLPFVLLLLDYWPLRRLDQSSQIYPRLKEKIPLIILAAISCASTFLVRQILRPSDYLPLWLRIEDSIVSYVVYLRQIVWPAGLAAFYPGPTHSFSFWEVAGSLALLCLISAAAFASRKSCPYLLVGWLWFIGMLIPVIGLAQISIYSHADRYTYLPQIGLCFAGTWMAADWAGQRRVRRATLGAVAVVILCALLIAGWRETAWWRDSETLWTHALECTQDNWLAHNNLGLAKKGRTDEAIAQFREAVRIKPDYPVAHFNLGNALQHEGRIDEAIAEFRRALAIDSTFSDASNNLGLDLFNRGQTDEAIALYRQALQSYPTYAEAHNNLGNALEKEGHTEEAIAEYREALRVIPAYADAHNNLGIALAHEGRTDEAIAEYREALRINPADAAAQNNLANALLQNGRPDDAIAQYRETLRFNPANADAHGALGNALFQQGQIAEAIAQYREAIAINPADAETHNNLGFALFKQGQIDEAIAEYRQALQIDPNDAQAHINLGNALLAQGEAAEALVHLQKALELQPANLALENKLAWVLATAPQLTVRDGARAVQLATQANQSSGGNNSLILRTLAAAYAQAGQYPDAVQTAQRALQLAQAESNNALTSALPREIKLYEAGRPFEDVHP
jgi:tetratricopeptide (TPR) repeat protein